MGNAPDALPRLTSLLTQGLIRPHGDDSDTAGIREALKDRDTETRDPLE
jgi:hypothetical protein